MVLLPSSAFIHMRRRTDENDGEIPKGLARWGAMDMKYTAHINLRLSCLVLGLSAFQAVPAW